MWQLVSELSSLLCSLRDQTDVHHIANAPLCCILLQRAPAEAQKDLLIATTSTVHGYEERRHVRAITSSSADISASCLLASHLQAGGDATAHQLVELSLFICCALRVRLSSGFQLTIMGQWGVSAFWMSCRPYAPWGKWQHGRLCDSLSNGSFFSYLASVEKVPDRIIKGVISTLNAFNGAG